MRKISLLTTTLASLAAIILFSSCSQNLAITHKIYPGSYFVKVKTPKTQNKAEVDNVRTITSLKAMQPKTASRVVSLEAAVPVMSLEKTIYVAGKLRNTKVAVMQNNATQKEIGNRDKIVASQGDKIVTADNGLTLTSGGGKSQLVALLLVLFLGALGIHRFYLGYVGIGLIQLFTLGGCGIWSFIDLIRIIIGDLKPKDGDYDETL